MMGKRNSIQAEDGSTLIEFALVLTLLLTLTFGMIDLARYVYTVSVVRAAAQEGARAGVIDQADAEDVQDAAYDKIVGLDPDQVAVDLLTPFPLSDEATVEVQVTYPFEFVTPFLAAAIGGPVLIEGTASMAAY